jgi:hypothetical protein
MCVPWWLLVWEGFSCHNQKVGILCDLLGVIFLLSLVVTMMTVMINIRERFGYSSSLVHLGLIFTQDIV